MMDKLEWMERLVSWAWRWRWAILMNAYLLSPIALYELNLGGGGPDKTILFTLPASLLGLLTVQFLGRRLWLTHLLLFPFYLVVGVDLYVIFHYETRLSSSMLLVILENSGHAHEYVVSHFIKVVGPLLLLLAAYAYGLFKIRALHVTLPRSAVLVPLAAMAVLYGGILQFKLHIPLLVATHDRSIPFGVFSQSYVAYRVYRDSLQEMREARAFTFNARRPDAPSEPEVYVLLIGESARPDHWGLYGYPRDTTPRLGQIPNLVVYRNVVSQSGLTQKSVPLILTRGSVEQPQRAARERSIVSVFRETHFATYWVSTQQRDSYTGAINRYSGEAETQRFFERRYDAVVLDAVRKALSESENEKLFFVIHTMGSHWYYSSRYPKEFEKFPVGGPGSTLHESMINAYDNTVVYSDFVISELIALLNDRPGLKALLYVSDHGENLEDDDRKLFGHFNNNEYDIPIPMLFWYSDDFAARFPEKIALAKENARRPVNTRAVFHSLVHLAGISLSDPDTTRLSVFSRELANVPRLVFHEPKAFDFDLELVPYNSKAQHSVSKKAAVTPGN